MKAFKVYSITKDCVSSKNEQTEPDIINFEKYGHNKWKMGFNSFKRLHRRNRGRRMKIDFSLEDVCNGLPTKNDRLNAYRNWLEAQGIDFKKHEIILDDTGEYIKGLKYLGTIEKVDFKITLSKDGVEIE